MIKRTIQHTCWLVHPVERLLTVYRLDGEEYGKQQLYELSGETQVAALPEIVIQWDELVVRLPDDLSRHPI